MEEPTIRKMMTDTQIVDAIITRCADNTRRGWNDKTSRDEFTGIVKFIVEARKNGEDYGDSDYSLDRILYPEMFHVKEDDYGKS